MENHILFEVSSSLINKTDKFYRLQDDKKLNRYELNFVFQSNKKKVKNYYLIEYEPNECKMSFHAV